MSGSNPYQSGDCTRAKARAYSPGGEGGIRTLGPVFKTGALNHYATSPH